MRNTQERKLSRSQTLLWTGQMLHPDSPVYNMAIGYEIAAVIDPAAFKAAFRTMVAGCDVLRTVVISDDATPRQKVLSLPDFDLQFIDLSDRPDPEAAYKMWSADRSTRVFDLSETLFDSALIKLAPAKFVWYFNQHHLVTDGWSLTVLHAEMSKLYNLARNGQLPQEYETLPFADYLDFENRRKEELTDSPAAAYWQQKAENLPPPPRLYGEKGQGSTGRAERITLPLGTARSEALRALTKEKDLRAFTPDMSLFNIFTTVLFAFVQRVSGQNELLIGAPSHNRPTPAFKQTPGVFIEIFPLTATAAKGDTFTDLFRKVRSEAGQYLRYAQPGLSSPALSGSFNVFLNYISGKFGDFTGLPQRVDWLLPDYIDPAHHLRLHIQDFDDTGEFCLQFDLNTAVFDEQKRQNAPAHFLRLLDAFIENREQPIAACELLSDAEKRHLIYDLNNTKKDYTPAGQNLLTLFEMQVKKTPDAPALRFAEEVWTYREFNEKANRLARFLQTQGVDREQVIAICAERSLAMPLAIYGILKAGAAYLPIDPQHPVERVNFMLQDANVRLFLSQKHLTESLKPEGVQVINLDSDADRFTAFSGENLEQKPQPQDLAYVIYTSGSTGKPKGVAVEHRSIVNRLDWIKDLVQLDATDVYLQKTPYTFDVSVPEFFWALQIGGSIVMAQPGGHKSPPYLLDTIEKYGVTSIHFVPSMLRVFLEEKGLEKCASLRRVFISGEAISASLQNRFFNKFDLPLHNLYGPTEAAVEVTRWQCRPIPEDALVPIGVPVANTQIYLLDDELRPVPQGSPGELYIAGVQVACGYLNRPELTAERFVADPFSPDPGAKMYRSGDLARYRPDGVIEYLGRVDFQVKLRGFRIELGEIETRLEEHVAVTQAVAVVRENDKKEQELVAFYTGEKVPNDIPFIHHLAARLPEYMIPKHFVHLPEFPLGSSGKVRRKDLPQINFITEKATTTYAAPDTQLEEIIAEMWCELLPAERVGKHDNFLDLGGHSLTAIRLVSRIADAFELNLPIDLVFKNPTLATYAAAVEGVMLEILAEESGE